MRVVKPRVVARRMRQSLESMSARGTAVGYSASKNEANDFSKIGSNAFEKRFVPSLVRALLSTVCGDEFMTRQRSCRGMRTADFFASQQIVKSAS